MTTVGEGLAVSAGTPARPVPRPASTRPARVCAVIAVAQLGRFVQLLIGAVARFVGLRVVVGVSFVDPRRSAARFVPVSRPVCRSAPVQVAFLLMVARH